MVADKATAAKHVVSNIGGSELKLEAVQDSWADAEYFHFFRVCQVFVGYRKQTEAARLRSYMTRWQFHCMQERKVRKGTEENADMTVQAHRSSFLEALREHENLSHLIATERESFAEEMYQHTVIGGAKLFMTFWRCRVIRTLGIAFRKWYLEMRHYVSTKKMELLMISLDKGADELNERQAKMKEIEELNSRLQLSLLVVMSVLRLRTHSKLMDLCSSLKNDAKIRKQLFNEVMYIKDALKRFGAADALATATALERGKECLESLKSTQEHIQVAQEAQNKLKFVSAEIKKIQRELQNSKDIRDRNAGISSTGMGGIAIAPTAHSASKTSASTSTGQSSGIQSEEKVESKGHEGHHSAHHHSSHHSQSEPAPAQKKLPRRGSGGNGSSSSATPAGAS